ncbi:transposase [Solwaraspora sp. WMMA2056]|uniref:transposase n=1 Tax=Solwaraspora sp. WMMA2056 TaxID=3015161 RepID=UPI00259AF3AA|nr:transposase [Solwaraspora sp. WMMA2056]WJK39161.1 transposase [Solwaraspora sp. WMMA2056]
MADKKNPVQLAEPMTAEREFAQQLIERAKADGVSLVGPGGLLTGITRTVLESPLDAEMDAHLDTAGVDEETGRRTNIRNGHGATTAQTEVGPVRIQVPRNRAGSFTPRIVPKHARRLDGFNEAILYLYAKGLTTGEIAAHLTDVYGADVSRQLINRVTDSVLADMEACMGGAVDSCGRSTWFRAAHIRLLVSYLVDLGCRPGRGLSRYVRKSRGGLAAEGCGRGGVVVVGVYGGWLSEEVAQCEIGG